jgi:hypothetical protein
MNPILNLESLEYQGLDTMNPVLTLGDGGLKLVSFSTLATITPVRDLLCYIRVPLLSEKVHVVLESEAWSSGFRV